MNEFDNISDSLLATYVDEYVRRAIAEVRRHEQLNKETIRVSIEAAQAYHDSEFKIKHNIQVGNTYDNNGIYAHTTSDNLVRGAHLCVMRLCVDLQTPPKSYSALLPAPVEEQLTSVADEPLTFMQEDVDADAAEFVEIDDQEQEQVLSETGSGEATDSRDEADD